MSHTISTTAPTTDLWRVQLATGEIRTMDVDGLDAAFQAGTVDERTPVLAPGALGWTKLGAAAGLEDDAPAESANSPSLSPMAADIPGSHAAIHASAAPVSSDLADQILARYPDVSLDDDAFKTSKTKGFAFVAVGLAAVVGLVVGGARLAGQVEGTAASNAMRPAAAAPAAPVDVMDVDARARALSEDQKRRLLEADKLREAAQKAKVQAAPVGRAMGRAIGVTKDKKAPFVMGGDKYDPLNGAL